MISAIRQLHLHDAGGLEPGVIGLIQKIDHGTDLQLVQQSLSFAIGQCTAIERRRHLIQVVLRRDGLCPLSRTGRFVSLRLRQRKCRH
ncbi:hypothetical protein BOH73_23335 [Pseudomonas versuta]|nr:hypothetical protein BOH73_23335 [Pseudomonas versuta]